MATLSITSIRFKNSRCYLIVSDNQTPAKFGTIFIQENDPNFDSFSEFAANAGKLTHDNGVVKTYVFGDTFDPINITVDSVESTPLGLKLPAKWDFADAKQEKAFKKTFSI